MSRSRKKNMAGGWTTSISEKEDKRLWHRAFRHENKTLAKIQILQEDEIMFPFVREKSDPWSMAKDGKHIKPYLVLNSEILIGFCNLLLTKKKVNKYE